MCFYQFQTQKVPKQLIKVVVLCVLYKIMTVSQKNKESKNINTQQSNKPDFGRHFSVDAEDPFLLHRSAVIQIDEHAVAPVAVAAELELAVGIGEEEYENVDDYDSVPHEVAC